MSIDKPALYRKRPVMVEAMRWTGANANAIVEWAQGGWGKSPGIWLRQTFTALGRPIFSLAIPTLEGEMFADEGDWIIKGIQGEIYPCKPNIFAATYEAAKRPDGYELRWRGWEFKWTMLQGETVLRDRFDSRGDAFTWLLDNARHQGDTFSIRAAKIDGSPLKAGMTEGDGA